MEIRRIQGTNNTVTVAIAATVTRNLTATIGMIAGAIHLGLLRAHPAQDTTIEAFELGVGVVLIAWGVLLFLRPGPATFGLAAVNFLGIAASFPPVSGFHLDIVGVTEIICVLLHVIVIVGAAKLLGIGFRVPARLREVRSPIAVTAGFFAASLILPFAPLLGPDGTATTSAAVRNVHQGHSSSATAGERRTDHVVKGGKMHVVLALDNSFEPAKLRIVPGDTVKWVNKGKLPHTASADTGAFESANLDTGQSFSFTFEEEGVYFYYCKYHGTPRNGMWGSVTVAAKGHRHVPVHAASQPASTSSGSSQPATHQIIASDNAFTPSELHAVVGDTVRWTNGGAALHDVVSDTGSFSSGDLTPGSSFSHTFSAPGSYYYFCSYHGAPGAGMWGVVVVSSPGEEAPAPEPHHHPGTSPSHGSEADGKLEVGMTADSFTPRTKRVQAGDRIVWVNDSPLPHTVTSEDALFDSGIFEPGETFSHVFRDPGRYYYFCQLHGAPREGMWGVVIVSSKSPEPSPSPSAEPSPSPSPSPPDDDVDVQALDDVFEPVEFEVASGDSVAWKNVGKHPHTVTSDDGLFDSGYLAADERYSVNFDTPGIFYYFCKYHGDPQEGMWGVIRVVEPASEPSPTPIPTPDITSVALDPFGFLLHL